MFDLSGEIPPRAWLVDVVFFLSVWVWLMGINSSVYPDEPLSVDCGCWGCGRQGGQAHTEFSIQRGPGGKGRLAGRTLRNSDGETGEGREKLGGGGWAALAWTRCWGRLSGRDPKAMRGQGWLPQEGSWAERE